MYFFLILFSINFFYNFFLQTQAASATGWSILASNLIETPPHSHRSFMQCKQNCLQIKSRNTCFKAVGITRPLPIYKSAGYVYCWNEKLSEKIIAVEAISSSELVPRRRRGESQTHALNLSNNWVCTLCKLSTIFNILNLHSHPLAHHKNVARLGGTPPPPPRVNPPKSAKRIKQIKKWSPFFCFGTRSAIFWQKCPFSGSKKLHFQRQN